MRHLLCASSILVLLAGCGGAGMTPSRNAALKANVRGLESTEKVYALGLYT